MQARLKARAAAAAKAEEEAETDTAAPSVTPTAPEQPDAGPDRGRQSIRCRRPGDDCGPRSRGGACRRGRAASRGRRTVVASSARARGRGCGVSQAGEGARVAAADGGRAPIDEIAAGDVDAAGARGGREACGVAGAVFVGEGAEALRDAGLRFGTGLRAVGEGEAAPARLGEGDDAGQVQRRRAAPSRRSPPRAARRCRRAPARHARTAGASSWRGGRPATRSSGRTSAARAPANETTFTLARVPGPLASREGERDGREQGRERGGRAAPGRAQAAAAPTSSTSANRSGMLVGLRIAGASVLPNSSTARSPGTSRARRAASRAGIAHAASSSADAAGRRGARSCGPRRVARLVGAGSPPAHPLRIRGAAASRCRAARRRARPARRPRGLARQVFDRHPGALGERHPRQAGVRPAQDVGELRQQREPPAARDDAQIERAVGRRWRPG